MNRFGGIKLPPLSAAVNVASQIKRQILPSSTPAERPSQIGHGHGHGERVHFAQLPNQNHTTHGGTINEHHEMSNMQSSTNPFGSSNPNNPFLQNQMEAGEPGGFQQESDFNNAQGGIIKQSSKMSSVDFSEGSDFVEGKSDVKINEYQAAWNVTNAIQGMFIVSLPFAVQIGGYWAIAAMILVAQICCYTGKILVDCLYEIDLQTGRRIRVRDSYVAIAKECFGKNYGAKIVSIAQIIELLMTCILYVVVCGDLMIGTFPEGAIDTRSWMMLIGIFLLPLGK
ncbi:vesicular inhibitory amino acid transporter-like [Dendroctonus ponderosae]|nr:vesicular inhibitory amino acid transporter-like [Dendroctonus ponderosae]KAH1015412.1 hypothetical protein HUJ05_013139 [Dendroctonus ponderosae]